MSFVSINLTTKALIRALQWRQLEREDKAVSVARGKKSKRKGTSK